MGDDDQQDTTSIFQSQVNQFARAEEIALAPDNATGQMMANTIDREDNRAGVSPLELGQAYTALSSKLADKEEFRELAGSLRSLCSPTQHVDNGNLCQLSPDHARNIEHVMELDKTTAVLSPDASVMA